MYKKIDPNFLNDELITLIKIRKLLPARQYFNKNIYTILVY